MLGIHAIYHIQLELSSFLFIPVDTKSLERLSSSACTLWANAGHGTLETVGEFLPGE